MVQKLLYVLVVVLLSKVSFGQWETLHYINDVDALPYLMSCDFEDVNYGLAAGDGAFPVASTNHMGGVVKTLDAGVTWENAFLSYTHNFMDVEVVGASAYGVGIGMNSGIIVWSHDSAATWDSLITPSGLISVDFPSPTFGYVAGADGLIMKTSDSGNTWLTLSMATTGNLKACTFVNDTTGFVGSDTTLFRTEDGGLSWSEIALEGQIYDMSMVDEQIGYTLTLDFVNPTNRVYKTTDGGNQWTEINTFTGNHLFSAISFATENNGFLVGPFLMEKTTDGGANWHNQFGTPPAGADYVMDDIADVLMLNPDTAFIVGYMQVYRTMTGGSEIGLTTEEFLQQRNMEVYPNPASETALFRFDDDVKQLTIRSIDGKVVVVEQVANGGRHRVDVSDWSPGVYFYEASGGIDVKDVGKLVVR